MKALARFWAIRSQREKLILGGGGAIVTCMLIYAYALKPMDVERKILAARLPEMRSTAAQMQVALEEVNRLRSILPAEGANGASEATTRNILLKTLAEDGMDADNIEVLKSGRFKISLRMIPFEKYPKWLETLQAKHGMRLESGSLQVVGEPNMIDATSTLIRP